MTTNLESVSDKRNSNLNKLLNDELIRIRKYDFLLSAIKSYCPDDSKLNNENRINTAIDKLHSHKYMKFNDCNILGLESTKSIQLSYTEKKAIRKHVIEFITKSCNPIVKYFDTIQKELPDITNTKVFRKEIIKLGSIEKDKQLQLLKLKNKKCELLKHCAELKLSPFFKNNIEAMYIDYKLIEIKAKTLQEFLLHKFFTSTDHTTKAIRKVALNIEKKLDE